MHEEWTDRLSDYLDDELSPDERAAVEAHLKGCSACTAVLNELKLVVVRARTLDAPAPQADLWPAIAERLGRRPWARRMTFTVPQALAASLAIALLSGGLVWQAAGRHGHEPAGRSTPAPSQELTVAPDSAPHENVAMVSFADAQYDAAVADLEKALKEGRGHLDKSTIAIVEHNLQIIDQAIEQARQALETDPANDYLSSHLVEARRRKLDLLRRATALTETN